MKMEQKKNSSAATKPCRKKVNPVSLARSFRNTCDDRIRSDVDGSYTGVPREGDTPIQDVDDL